MSVYLYDEALTAKISNWTKSLDVHVYSPENSKRLFSVLADESHDSPIKLPIICLNRKPSFQVLNTNKQPLSYDGLSLESNKDRTAQLNAIPVQLSYSLDIYTRFLKEADEFVRNLIFNIVNFPSLSVTIPYNGYEVVQDCYIYMSNEVSDNSDIPERMIQGQFTRYSLNIELSEAYLWDLRIRPNVHIHDVQTVVDEIELHPTEKEHNFRHYILRKRFQGK